MKSDILKLIKELVDNNHTSLINFIASLPLIEGDPIEWFNSLPLVTSVRRGITDIYFIGFNDNIELKISYRHFDYILFNHQNDNFYWKLHAGDANGTYLDQFYYAAESGKKALFSTQLINELIVKCKNCQSVLNFI